jgi:CRISPR-associated protein Cmr1
LEKEITICKTVTPLLMAGADGRTLELRPPSIKGMMRFWWRAVNPHLSLEELKKQESCLFGSSNEKIGKSKIIIRIRSEKLEKIDYFLLPHRNAAPIIGISPDQDISITLSSYSDIQVYSSILNLCLILSGFGKRSRRGFGSLKPENINVNIENIFELITRIGSNDYEIKSGKIVLKKNFAPKHRYPFLREIALGGEYADWKEVLESIGTASSKCCNPSLGSVSSWNTNRLASPIYISVLKNSTGIYFPIVSTLNTVFKDPTNKVKVNYSVQEKFKVMIL